MDLLGLLRKRKSIRTYTDAPVTDEHMGKILQAALLAPSSRAFYPAEFIVVRDREMLSRLAMTKAGGSAMLKEAGAAVVVIGDSKKSDAWIEDCSICLTNMMLQAAEMGIGSCWSQIRNRASSEENVTADEYLHTLLDIPEQYSVEAILSLGFPDVDPGEKELPDTDSPKVHYGRF